MLIALINTIISLYYYLLVVKAMFIKDVDEMTVASFRSAFSERLGMWICVAGILGLGLVSWFYDSLLCVVGL